MSLLIELKERRTHVLEELNRVEDLRAELADFDRVIAALEPKAVADEWHEDFLALTDEQPELFDEPQEIEASSQSESCVPELGAETDLQTSPGEAEESRDQFEEEAERAAAIELTADVMPESGLHEEAPALNEQMQDEREQPVTDVAALIASGEHSYDEVAAIAYPEPDGYAPVTNPDADAIARAHEYYSPEKMGDRNRSVFDIFRHKREDA